MSLIDQLAQLVGFHQSYQNSFNQQVFASEQAKRALLQAMGYQVDDPKALQQAIIELEQKPWRQVIKPTLVVAHEQAHKVGQISIPAEVKELTVEIIEENGNHQISTINVATLTRLAEHTIDDNTFCQYQLALPELAMGYHQLKLSFNDQTAHCYLIYAPKTCYSVDQASSHKMWGIAAQLYSLRSEQNFGMGDFNDLAQLAKQAGRQQIDAIGLNPLHPLFVDNPAHRSPYSPSMRCLLNTLYISVVNVPNFKECKKAQTLFNSVDFQQHLTQARATELIDYPHVAWLKYQLLELLFEHFEQQHLAHNSELAKQFNQFCQQQGKTLEQLAVFEALYQHFRAIDENAYGWPHWPKAYQNPNSDEVVEFAQQHQSKVLYFKYLQWLAHLQLTEVKTLCQQHEMAIGLYLDLAVGCDSSGCEVWANQSLYLKNAGVGAPPDTMNSLGQDWGLTPMNPVELQKQGYQPLAQALRSNMQYAGALRIDHILGLMRQYWVAPGMKADQGVYISFPLQDILRIIALESQRAKCVVIGEDLGTTPDGFTELMHSAGLLSYKILFFERWESGLFKRPETYTEQAMVTISTHDLPTLAGWWQGNDLTWRQQLNLYPNEQMGAEQRADRVNERHNFIAALIDQQVIDQNQLPTQAPAQMNTELGLAAQRFLAKTACKLQLIPLEDMLFHHEQVNIPGTIDEHPNWLQKLPVKLENFWQQPQVTAMVHTMQQVRPKATKVTRATN